MIFTDQIQSAAWDASKVYHLDENLILAIIWEESKGDTYRCRFEPLWTYVKDVDRWAVKCGITSVTEKVMQMISWGPMQVMGTVLRELGFDRNLVEATDLHIGIDYGAKKLKSLSAKYLTQDEWILAYNAGSPRKDPSGKWVNQSYLDRVKANLKLLDAP